MKTRTRLLDLTAAMVLFIYVAFSPPLVSGDPGRRVDMTLVRGAAALGAFCLDGSLPAYHLDRGFGAGSNNWLLEFEGGGWCNDIASCVDRAKTRRGSTRYMSKTVVFSGILSNNASLNPDFYNWNKVRLRYCDGASFAGDSQFGNGTSLLYFRGQRIWNAIILDLLPKGLAKARKALLTGCSAGGLSTFLHCDNFTSYLPKNASVKCMSDAGFFLDAIDVAANRTMRSFYTQLVSLQGVQKNLDPNCTHAFYPEPALCFFPQYVLRFIKTPFFILNSAYDVFQFHHGLVPPTADRTGRWNRCKLNVTACNPHQLDTLQGFRKDMLGALMNFFRNATRGGMFINSCFDHCQSALQETWFSPISPRIHNKTIAETVGDWYFGRGEEAKEIGCPYPCDKTCHNLIPASTTDFLASNAQGNYPGTDDRCVREGLVGLMGSVLTGPKLVCKQALAFGCQTVAFCTVFFTLSVPLKLGVGGTSTPSLNRNLQNELTGRDFVKISASWRWLGMCFTVRVPKATLSRT